MVTKKSKLIVILLTTLFIFVFAWALLIPKIGIKEKVTEVVAEQRQKADLYFKGLTISEVVGGTKYWELNATSSRVNKTTGLTSLQNIQGKFFKNNKPTLGIIAPKASWKMDEKSIMFELPFGYNIEASKILTRIFKQKTISRLIYAITRFPIERLPITKTGYWFKGKSLIWNYRTKQMLVSEKVSLVRNNLFAYANKMEGDAALEEVFLSGDPRIIIRLRGQKEITIKAKYFKVNGKANVISTIGNVTAYRKDFKLTCQKAWIYGEEEKIKAYKDVQMKFDDITASSQAAVFSLEDQKLVLTDNPQVIREADILQGEKITVWLKTKQVTISGKTKVIIRSQ